MLMNKGKIPTPMPTEAVHPPDIYPPPAPTWAWGVCLFVLGFCMSPLIALALVLIL